MDGGERTRGFVYPKVLSHGHTKPALIQSLALDWQRLAFGANNHDDKNVNNHTADAQLSNSTLERE